MSTAAAPGRTRPLPKPATRPSVRVVPPPYAPARAPFVIVVLVILTLGLGALLLLNTLLAQGSFTLHTLNDRVSSLADREQALQQRASELAAPQRLARRAQELGMVPSQNPAFLTAEGGKILGEPVPAAAPVQPAPVVGSSDTAASNGTQTGGTGGGQADGSAQSQSDNQSQSDKKSAGADGRQKTTSGEGTADGGDGGADR